MVKSWIIESRERRWADLNPLVRRESGQTWLFGQRSSLLPSTAQSLVELYQRQQFVAFRLSQGQLSIEQLTIGIEGIQKRVDAAFVSEMCQS